MLLRRAFLFLALSLRRDAAHGNQLREIAPEHRSVQRPAVNCDDGEDCTSTQCKNLATEEAKREICENVPSLNDIAAISVVTDPPARSSLALNTNVTEGPFCVKFNDPPDTEGFAPCPGVYDNIFVNPSSSIAPFTDDSINPLSGDDYLHLRDDSGGSLACGTGDEYTGDWTPYAATKCHELCFDVKLFHDGCHSNVPGCTEGATGGYFINIFPALIIQGGGPDYLRAVFRAYNYMTDADGDSPEWRRICAPLLPLNGDGTLPSNDDGYWYMAGPNNVLGGGPPVTGPPSPDSAWPTLLADVTAIQLPIDFTGNPAERAGYDNICMRENDCEDLCDPEPLCYWQHEWKCEDVKDEEWYKNFTQIVSPLETFPEKYCLCKILDENCCCDLCDTAEREFMALLLNVASGKLAEDCGVLECDDCLYNVTSIISTVDHLLAPSSRSDYDCSKALQYLTGINLDEILCDTPAPTPDPCPQTDECFVNEGTCVPVSACTPSPTVACETHFCGTEDGTVGECTCEMSIPCPQTNDCLDEGGRCIKNCEEIPGLVVCKDSCSPNVDPADPNKCMCEIKEKPCTETTQCQAKHGECVKEEDCDTTLVCDPDLCIFSEGCVCQYASDTPVCEDLNQQCVSQGNGECVAASDCVPIPGVRKCKPDLCTNGIDQDSCLCKIEGCQNEDSDCLARGGTCKVYDLCNTADPAIGCDPSLCGNGDSCVCEYPIPDD